MNHISNVLELPLKEIYTLPKAKIEVKIIRPMTNDLFFMIYFYYL